MYSDSSEYDDEMKENEINLYSQVYFESEAHNDIHVKSSNSKVSIDTLKKKSDPTQNIDENLNMKSALNNTEEPSKILLYSEETSDASHSKKSYSTLGPESRNKYKRRQSNKEGTKEVMKISSHRQRKSSICSLDSISGKEPLDSLYCDGLSDEEINLNTIAEEDFEDEEYVPLKKKKSLETISEEVTILPTPTPVTPPLEILDSSSNESIKIVGYLKKRTSLFEAKMGQFEFESHSSSESDEFDLDYLSHVKNNSLCFNVDLDTRSSVLPNGARVRDKSLKFTKSQVIFSKGRPLSKRHPSCPKWTPDMTSLYDSDYCDEFSVRDVHKTQTDSPNYWRICKEDGPTFRRNYNRKRYFQMRCKRCKEEDHEVENCPRVVHCLYCASPSHKKNNCPKYCCFKCGKDPHRYCYLTHKEICECCKSNGHDSNVCPDLWRRYHITVAGSVPIAPDNSSATNAHPPYCYNCGKKGHYGHQCTEKNFKKFTPVTTLIQSYSNPNSTEFSNPIKQSPKKTKRSISTSAHNLKKIAGNKNEGLNQIMKASQTTITTKKKHSKLIVEGPIANVKHAFQLISTEFSKTGKTLKMPPSMRARESNFSGKFDPSIPLVIYPKSLSKETTIIKRFPLSLPSKRNQALQAISNILEPVAKSLYSPNSKLLKLKNKVMQYFEICDISNPQSTKDFSSYIHLLTSITNRNSPSLKYITRDLWKIKKTLQVYRHQQLDPAVYDWASSIYTSMIDPPSKTIIKMLTSLSK